MSEGKVYNEVGLLEEAQRYQTSTKFLELLYDEFNGTKRLLIDGLGPRLLTISSALTEELCGVDVNQGSINRSKEFILSWQEYKDSEPFKTEFDFLERKKLDPRFDNCNFYMLKELPVYLKGSFDSELASELFLHLNVDEIQDVLNRANHNLDSNGKFLFSVYVSGYPNSLDKKFYDLGASIGLRKEDFIENGKIDIKTLTQKLKKDYPGVYNAKKQKCWLDLTSVRVFFEESIEKLCQDYEFKIKEKLNINGGMFSFAHRLIYVLDK